MPVLSATDDKYTILKIHYDVGDFVNKSDIFMDVENNGAAMNVGFYFSGKLTEICVSEGQTVRYNALLGVVESDGE